MTNNKYDVAIIGAGVAGCFAALKIQQKYKLKTIVFDIGRPFQKRRRFLEGALGCFPNSDGKLYPNNLNKIKELVDGRTVNSAYKWVNSMLSEAGPLKLVKDTIPLQNIQKKIKEHKFELESNDYIQWKPEAIHKFSKFLVAEFEDSKHVEFSFDNEVHKILKKKDTFHISSELGEYQCKNVIFCPGRTGWRWATDFYKEMGMEVKDDVAKFGVRFEIAGQYVKELNKSHCMLLRDDIDVGPFAWNGTIIPEDHADLVCSNFRSNEERWHSEKVSFSLIGKINFPGKGIAQTERMANLSYLLFNDRVSREKIKVFLKESSQLNLIPEYKWFTSAINELDQVIPNLISRGYYHVPNILPMPAQIELNSDLSSEVEGLYIGGEGANIPGILGAAVSGTIIADNIAKG